MLTIYRGLSALFRDIQISFEDILRSQRKDILRSFEATGNTSTLVQKEIKEKAGILEI